VNVPPLPNHFLGRADLVNDLVQRLLAGASPALSAQGLPGVGKTALAVILAHHPKVLKRFADGVLWTGLGPNPDVMSALAIWGDALGVDVTDQATPQARAQAVHNAIGQRRLLLVIDDVWDIKVARPFRCSGPHCVHLLTSRDQAIARAFAGPAQTVSVPVLEDDPAFQLLQAHAPEACAADPVAARRLAQSVGGLPLALELLGGYLAAPEYAIFPELSQKAFADLASPARRLQLAQRRLGAQEDKVVTLQEVIALSLEPLPRPAVAAFYALGAFAAKPATFDRQAAQAVTGADAPTLAALVARNLLEGGGEGALALHQTLADAARTATPPEAIARHRDYYLAQVNEDREAWPRIEAIYPQVKHAWSALPADETLFSFVWVSRIYQERRGLWPDYLAWAESGLKVAQALGRKSETATLLVHLGFAYNALGDKPQALEYYNQALPLYLQVGDKGGEATTLNNLGAVYSDLGEKQKALEYYNQALPLYRQVGDKGGEAATLNNIGLVYDDLGDKPKALAYYNQVLEILRQIGDKAHEAGALNNLGGVYYALGDKPQALEYYNQALPLMRQVGDKGGEATTLNNIGKVYYALGDKPQALEYYNQALPLYRQVGDKGGEATTLNNLGLVYDDLGDKPRALEYYNQALPLYRQVGDKGGEATTLTNIGKVYSALGDKPQALEYYNQALPLMRQVGDKGGEATTLNNIGKVYDDLGDKPQALEYYNQALPLRRQVGDKGGEATTLNNIGAVYDALGDKPQALEYFNQALPLYRQVGDKAGEATTLAWLGHISAGEENFTAALDYYAQSLDLLRQIGDRWTERQFCRNVAFIYQAMGDLAQAEEQLQIVVALAEAIGHPDLESDRAALATIQARRRL